LWRKRQIEALEKTDDVQITPLFRSFMDRLTEMKTAVWKASDPVAREHEYLPPKPSI
jgi:hypothetical protein